MKNLLISMVLAFTGFGALAQTLNAPATLQISGASGKTAWSVVPDWSGTLYADLENAPASTKIIGPTLHAVISPGPRPAPNTVLANSTYRFTMSWSGVQSNTSWTVNYRQTVGGPVVATTMVTLTAP